MSGLVRTRCGYSPARRRAEPSHQRGDLHYDDNVSVAPGWRTSGRMTVCSGQGEVSGSQSGSLCVNTGGGGSGSNSFQSGAGEEVNDVSGPLSPSGTPQRACQASSGVRAAAGGQVLARDGPEPGCLARPAASSSSVVDLVSSSDSSGVQIVDAEGGDESGTQSADAPLQEGVDCLLTRDTGVVWNVTLPHLRSQCGEHPFRTICSTENAKCCELCFCFICDTKAAECHEWGTGTRGGHHCNAHDSGKFRAMKAAAKGASAAAGAPVLPLQLPPANSFAAMQRKRRAPAPGPLQRRRARLLPASFQSEN
mmetsp:Transcript_30973/g.79525  ORF Transcript_30973/g.79525 Transcript_30973/m.79525 type:complete len:309 (+) Transcript_30973:27-953(+)